MSQSNPPGRFCWVVWDGWCPNPTSRSCMVCGPSCSGYCTPWVVGSLDRSCLVFGPGFPYKLCQLSSSNKKLGKCKYSPSVQKNIALMVPDLASKFARMHTSWKGFILHGKENTSSLPESGIALAAPNFLECPNQTASFLGSGDLHTRKYIFLGRCSEPPRYYRVSLTVYNYCQGNYLFPWVHFETAKEMALSLTVNCNRQKMINFLGCSSNRQVNYNFLEGYRIFLGVSTQWNDYKYFRDSHLKKIIIS
jgi:hypothetical protein